MQYLDDIDSSDKETSPIRRKLVKVDQISNSIDKLKNEFQQSERQKGESSQSTCTNSEYKVKRTQQKYGPFSIYEIDSFLLAIVSFIHRPITKMIVEKNTDFFFRLSLTVKQAEDTRDPLLKWKLCKLCKHLICLQSRQVLSTLFNDKNYLLIFRILEYSPDNTGSKRVSHSKFLMDQAKFHKIKDWSNDQIELIQMTYRIQYLKDSVLIAQYEIPDQTYSKILEYISDNKVKLIENLLLTNKPQFCRLLKDFNKSNLMENTKFLHEFIHSLYCLFNEIQFCAKFSEVLEETQFIKTIQEIMSDNKNDFFIINTSLQFLLITSKKTPMRVIEYLNIKKEGNLWKILEELLLQQETYGQVITEIFIELFSLNLVMHEISNELKEVLSRSIDKNCHTSTLNDISQLTQIVIKYYGHDYSLTYLSTKILSFIGSKQKEQIMIGLQYMYFLLQIKEMFYIPFIVDYFDILVQVIQKKPKGIIDGQIRSILRLLDLKELDKEFYQNCTREYLIQIFYFQNQYGEVSND